MKTRIKQLAALAILLGLSLTGRASFAAALNALDDLGAYGTSGTLGNPDFYIRGFSVFGATNVLTHVSTTTGNAVINGAMEVSSDVYVVKNATFTGNVYLGDNALYVGGGSAGQILHQDAGGWLSWTDVAAVSDNLGTHVATTTLNMAGNSLINVATGAFLQGITASSFTATDPSLGVNSAKFRFTDSNLVVSSASSAQYGGIYVSTNIYLPAGAAYYGDGSGLTGVDIRYNLTRALKTLGSTVDIGTFNTTGGNHSLYITVSVSEYSSWSVTKQYLIPISYSMTGGGWRDALPIANVVNYTLNDFVLEVNVGPASASLRLRRTLGSSDGTAVINIEQLGPTADVFTPSSATGSSSANALLAVTPLTQSGGNVGIGTGSPAALLHLSSGTIQIDGSAANSVIAAGNVGIGTTNPTEALYVVGNATVTQTVAASTFSASGSFQMSGTVVIDRLRGVYPKTLSVEQPVTLSTLTVTGSDFSVGGSTLVAKAGKVGIGTTNPAHTFQVQGTDSASAGIYFNDALPSGITNTMYNIGGLLYWNTGLIGGFGTPLTGSGTANYLPKWTGTTVLGNSVMYESSSKIGIGNTAPAQKLDVTGAVALSGIAALEQSGSSLRINQSNQFSLGVFLGSSTLRIGGTTGLLVGSAGADGQIGLVPNGVDNTRRISLYGGIGDAYFSGNIGISTGIPAVKLDIIGNETRVGPTAYTSSYSVTSGAYLVLDKSSTTSDSAIMFRDQGNARAEIGFSGDNNVHLKTATGSPYGSETFTDRLIVYTTGAVSALGTLRSYATSGASKILSGSTDGSTTGTGLEMYYDFTAALSKLTSLTRPSTFRALVFEGSSLRFRTGSASVTERMRIDSGGNVGIGNTTPLEKLDIIGNVRIEGTNTPFFDYVQVGTASYVYTPGYAYPLKFDGSTMQLNANGSAAPVVIGTTYTVAGILLDVNGVINAATGYRVAGAAVSARYLRGDGTNFVGSTLQSAELNAAMSGIPNFTLSVSNVSGSAVTFVHTDAALAAFDATNPAALGTAGPGAAAAAARRDHVHPAADLGTGAVTGILPLSRGGMGQATAGTAGKFLKGDGTYWGESSLPASGTGVCGAGTWIYTLNSDAGPTCTQPGFSNISGTATLAQLPYGISNQLVGTNAAGNAPEFKTLYTGSGGSNFVILHSAISISFNLPSAGSGARGAVTTGGQTFAGGKTFNGVVDAPSLSLTGNGAGITFSGTGPNQIVTASGFNLALMPGGTGNVGIGKTGPSMLLDVNDVVNAATGYRIGTAASGSYLRGNGTNFVSNTIQSADMPAGWLANLGSQKVTTSIISGTPSAAMRSDATLALNMAMVPNWTGLHTFSNATYSAVFTGGNVGIGTASPGYTLDVQGTIGTVGVDTLISEKGASLAATYLQQNYYYRHCINYDNTCPPPACEAGDSVGEVNCMSAPYVNNHYNICERGCCHTN